MISSELWFGTSFFCQEEDKVWRMDRTCLRDPWQAVLRHSRLSLSAANCIFEFFPGIITHKPEKLKWAFCRKFLKTNTLFKNRYFIEKKGQKLKLIMKLKIQKKKEWSEFLWSKYLFSFCISFASLLHFYTFFAMQEKLCIRAYAFVNIVFYGIFCLDSQLNFL